mgnify:CR=1 FL=1
MKTLCARRRSAPSFGSEDGLRPFVGERKSKRRKENSGGKAARENSGACPSEEEAGSPSGNANKRRGNLTV